MTLLFIPVDVNSPILVTDIVPKAEQNVLNITKGLQDITKSESIPVPENKILITLNKADDTESRLTAVTLSVEDVQSVTVITDTGKNFTVSKNQFLFFYIFFKISYFFDFLIE